MVMRFTNSAARALTRAAIITAAGFCLATIVASARGGATTPQAPSTPAPPPVAVVRDTRSNLQDAFQNEVNAKARYEAAARIAAQENDPAVARLFRALAASEQVHADQDVHAIAWLGNEAKAYMEKSSLGTTEQNLRAAIDRETYEATQLSPALLARARSEHQSPAVRSLTFALASEREHAKRLTAALAQLDARPAPQPLYVCGFCGMVVDSIESDGCHNCFSSAHRFTRVD
jgi:rubrerythrin